MKFCPKENNAKRILLNPPNSSGLSESVTSSQIFDHFPYSRPSNKFRALIYVLQLRSGIKIDFLQALIYMITIKVISIS